MKKVKLKIIFNVIFVVLLLFLTLHFIFKNQELTQIIKYIRNVNMHYIIISLLFVGFFICSESLIISYLMRSLTYHVNFIKCIKYSIIGFFVSSITPAASGGQPAQMYYMKMDGISVAVSTLVLMIITAAYKFVLIFFAIIMFIFDWDFALTNTKLIEYVVIYGIISNILVIFLLLFVVFRQSFAKREIYNIITFLGKAGIIKNHYKITKKAIKSIEKYDTGAKYFKEHKVVLLNVFILTIVQRFCLFLVTYFVYKSFGLNGISALEIVILQTLIAIAVENLPLPGGIGASESIFVIFFKKIFGETLVIPGMVLSRGISFYSFIILGLIVMGGLQFKFKKRNQ